MKLKKRLAAKKTQQENEERGRKGDKREGGNTYLENAGGLIKMKKTVIEMNQEIAHPRKHNNYMDIETQQARESNGQWQNYY